MPKAIQGWLFYAFAALMLASLAAGLVTDNYVWFLVPFGLAVTGIGVANIRLLFYALLFLLPLSIELQLPGGFGTDFPDEILIVALMFVTFAYIVGQRDERLDAVVTNPIALLLVVHFAWIVFTLSTSSLFIVSLKYTLAKLWYLTTFVVLAVILIRGIRDVKPFFWLITVPLLFTVFYTLVRHGAEGFTFAAVNTTMWPFFRNHVNYAAMLAAWLPFVWLAWQWSKGKDFMRFVLLAIGAILIAALILSFTRSSWLAAVAAVGAALLVRWKLMRFAVWGATLALIAGVVYLRLENRFMDYAPNFDTTIYHENLDDHLSSTYKLEDISSAERVYRWVAGFKMWEANPLVGYGPGNFYNFYKSYTVNAFQTYVSDNPEKSTVHNYFLLLLVEQGIIGLLIFLVLTFAIFIYAERLYHRVTNPMDRMWTLAIVMSLTAIYVCNMLSDLIETDKIGSLFFINIAMLMVLMHKYPSKKAGGEHADIVAK